LSPEIINSIVPAKNVSQFKVFPNPVSGELFIQTNQSVDEDFKFELYSVKGELIRKECLEAERTLYRIDVNSLKDGVYFLRLISVSGKYSEEVIIKNK
jgi:hypothetical protein